MYLMKTMNFVLIATNVLMELAYVTPIRPVPTQLEVTHANVTLDILATV
jgi:hypothetical protein